MPADNLGIKDGGNIEIILYWELSTLFRKGSLFDKLVNEDKSKCFILYSFLCNTVNIVATMPIKLKQIKILITLQIQTTVAGFYGVGNQKHKVFHC